MTLPFFRLKDFLTKNGWRSPIDKNDTAHKLAHNTSMHYFEWISQPDKQYEREQFHQHMKFKTLGEKWHEAFPIDQILDHNGDPSSVLLVDVGGSNGHDL